MGRYPKLVLHLDRIADNASKVGEMCASAGAAVAAVPKGVCSDLRVARAMLGGCGSFADSRVQNLT
ncbi:MAG: alanine/ornithine racemase family PLP-dependent enzyme, partial [Synergistaceae bacterium]|nr:alanine/ornithine racemase family PLP-dependent enzyme [Synergistaceae bacterium]